MDLVQNYQAISVRLQIESGVFELGQVPRSFQVEVDRGCPVSDLMSQCGFSHLTRPEKRHCGEGLKQLLDALPGDTVNMREPVWDTLQI